MAIPVRLRVLVTGGRDYTDRDRVTRVLDLVHERIGVLVVIHGGATGADTLASEWAIDRGVPTEPYAVTKEEWRTQGISAGPRRNARMLAASAPDVVVAFPGGRGTANMTSLADEATVPILDARPGNAIQLIEGLEVLMRTRNRLT